MKYNDYPLPNEELIGILSNEYLKKQKTNVLKVCEVSYLEQKSKLSELYMYINAQNEYLKQLIKMNRNLNIKINPEAHLKILSDLGVENFSVKKQNNSKSCFYDYLKCEAEILKILMFLIFLDNLNYNKLKLTKILTEQIDIFNAVVYS